MQDQIITFLEGHLNKVEDKIENAFKKVEYKIDKITDRLSEDDKLIQKNATEISSLKDSDVNMKKAYDGLVVKLWGVFSGMFLLIFGGVGAKLIYDYISGKSS